VAGRLLGPFVEAFGYGNFFIATACLGVPVLLLVWLAGRAQPVRASPQPACARAAPCAPAFTYLYRRDKASFGRRAKLECSGPRARVITMPPMHAQLLMIEDDTRLAQMVGEYLERSGFGVTKAPTPRPASPAAGAAGRARPRGAGPDAAGHRRPRGLPAHPLLPGDAGKVPVLMLTAKGDPMDRIVGLELGADDYLPKPFEPRELLARIRAILRRRGEGAPPPAKRLRFGSLEIDRDARTVTVAGQPCDLTSYQFDLLVVLAERAGRVLTRDQIMEAVRGRELEAFDRSIDVHMGRIRAAIEADAKNPKRILTVRGVGYVFAKQQD
jgi:DNA-binding response OmpR family regulator